jgi:hypothetical protein
MSFSDDQHMDVCQNIEVGLKLQYERDPQLTDAQCIMALDNAKIAIKHQFGFAPNESVSSNAALQGVIDWCVGVGMERIGKINDLTLKEYVARLEKIKQSVILHADGVPSRRRYYEFIQRFV